MSLQCVFSMHRCPLSSLCARHYRCMCVLPHQTSPHRDPSQTRDISRCAFLPDVLHIPVPCNVPFQSMASSTCVLLSPCIGRLHVLFLLIGWRSSQSCHLRYFFHHGVCLLLVLSRDALSSSYSLIFPACSYSMCPKNDHRSLCVSIWHTRDRRDDPSRS